MALQRRMLFLPTDAELISAHLAAARHDGRLTFFDASGPIFSCREADDGALRFAAAMLTEPALGLASPSQMARAVGRHRSRVHEYRTRYRAGGAAALEVKRRGPRGASKLKGGVLVRGMSRSLLKLVRADGSSAPPSYQATWRPSFAALVGTS